MRPARLGGEDSAWLHTDTPENHMIVTGVLELEGDLDRATLERVLRERVLRHPRFRARVVEPPFRVGRPRLLVSRDLDLREHLVEETLPDESEETLRRRVGELASLPLDLSRPLWTVHVLRRPGAGTALVFRIHHALGDGFALESVLLSMCDPSAAKPAVPRHRPSTSALEEARAVFRRPWRVDRVARTIGRFTGSLVHLVTIPRDAPGVLKGPLGIPKRVAWTKPLRLERVRQEARRLGVTVNDLIVSAVAGSLRRYVSAHGGVAIDVKAMIPVNLRTPEAALERLGNFFGMVILTLPLRVADATYRLAEVKRRMDRIKRTPEAVVGLGILQAMGRVPRWLERAGVVFFTRKASLVLTNVAGPESRPTLAGSAIRRVFFWVPQSGRVALGVSCLSFAGDIFIGVMSDAGRIPDPETIAAEIEAALESPRPGESAPAPAHAA